MDLVTFTEEIVNENLHFMYSANITQDKIISCRIKNEENIKSKSLIFVFFFLREWVEREARKVEQLNLIGLLMYLCTLVHKFLLRLRRSKPHHITTKWFSGLLNAVSLFWSKTNLLKGMLQMPCIG